MGVTAAPAGRPGDAAPLTFAKLHGLGNSYLFVYADRDPADPAALSVRLSDPRRGVGADGMIWILPSTVADFRMRVFNADGSEAAMCGNGIRCLGKYVYDRGLTARTELTVETPAGIRRLWLHTAGGRVVSVTADMGRAAVCAAQTLTLPGRRNNYPAPRVGGQSARGAVPRLHAGCGAPAPRHGVSDAPCLSRRREC